MDIDVPSEGDHAAAAALFDQIDAAARSATVEFEGVGTHVAEQRLTDEGLVELCQSQIEIMLMEQSAENGGRLVVEEFTATTSDYFLLLLVSPARV